MTIPFQALSTSHAARSAMPFAAFGALVEAIPLPVAVFDAGLELVAANDRYRELTGLGAAQAMGRSIREAFPNALGDLTAQIDAAVAGRPATATRIAFRRGTGERLVDVTFAPLGNGAASGGVVFTGAYVTDRDEAREARLEAVRRLASGVLHDINNVLNPIMAAAYLLQAHAENPDAVRDYAARISTAVELGAATAARVGRFIRQEPLQGIGAEELVDLSAVAEEVVGMTRPSWAERAGRPVELRDDLAGGALVRGIAGELRAAVLNLVQNALDAMAERGGTLGLRTRIVGDAAVLEVSDSGVGMPPDVRERAFEPFFSTKGRGSAGLGLAEVYGIAKRHNGRAEIESTPGVGTTVRIVLPLAVHPTGAERSLASGGGGTLTR